jgi:ABC-type multidrug transport system fused ATPase/permease subunit
MFSLNLDLMAATQLSTSVLLLSIWSHLSSRRKKQLLALIFLMVLTSITEVFSIGSVVPFLAILMTPDRIFTNELLQPFFEFFRIKTSEELLLPVTLFFVAAAIFASLARIFMLWAQTRLSMLIGLDFSVQVFENTLYQPYSFHVSRSSSELLAATQKAKETVIWFLQPCLVVLSSSIIIFAIAIALFLIDPITAISSFVGFGIVYAVIIYATKRRVERNSQIFAIQHERVTKVVQEGLGGIRDVIIDGTQAIYSRLYRDSLIPMQEAMSSNHVVGGSPRFAIEALGMVLIAGLAYFFTMYSGNSSAGLVNAIPTLGALAIGAQRLLPLLQQSYNAFIYLKGYQLVAQDTLELLNQRPSHNFLLAPAEPLQFFSSINIENLSFQYTPNGPWVLKNISLEISKGGRVGFVGATGSGKSTLLDIVMGLLTPTIGTVSVDKAEINPHNTRLWQANIAHVPQNIFLADTTIAENIAFGVPAALIDMKRVQEAAEFAEIGSTIEGWSEKYRTLVGERGLRLSGGQKQRIGIARALYKKANVLILDEATSALDSETEVAVMRAIEVLGRNVTILIIAHRPTTLRGCDFIVDLSDGCISSISSYQDKVMGVF